MTTKTHKITCRECGYAKSFPFSSPAAPILTALENAEKEGWAYQIGFMAMLTGEHYPICPKCRKEVKA